MSRGTLALIAFTLAIRVWFASAVTGPGLGDPAYYDDVAHALARGEGFVSRCLWNLLMLPPDLPYPACGYWGPGTPVVAGAAYAVFGHSVRAGQAAMIALSLGLTGIALALARRMLGDERRALAVGVLLAVHLQVTYFSITIDTPIVFALAANLALYPLARAHAGWTPGYFWALPGAVAAQLTRADGLLLPALAVAFAGFGWWRGRVSWRVPLALAALYLALMTPWYLRNASAFGTPFPSKISEGLALTDYSDLFRVHERPTFARLFARGAGAVLADKFGVLFDNLETLVFAENKLLVACGVFALPWLWRMPFAAPYLAYFVVLFLAMSFAFNHQSRFGSLLHSMPAMFPLFAVAAIKGIEIAGEAIAGWPPGFRRRMARAVVRVAPVLIVLYPTLQLTVGAANTDGFGRAYRELGEIGTVLRAWWATPGVGGPDVRLMSNNSLDLVTFLPCSVVQEPRDPGLDSVFELAARYRLKYFVVFRSPRWMSRPWDQDRYAHAAGELVRVADRAVTLSELKLTGVSIYEFRPVGKPPR